jgi:hypothetical protein
MTFKNRLSVVAVAVMATVSVLAPAVSASARATQTDAATRASRPDLTVTGGRILFFDKAVHWGIRHRNQVIAWSDRTKNIGSAAAARSRTGLQFIVRPGKVIRPIALGRPVPRLTPAQSHAGRDGFMVDMTDWKFGTYPTRVCADSVGAVAEANEANNCRRLHEIYVVPYDLKGRVTGHATFPSVFPGVTLRWTSDVDFSLKGLGDDRLRAQPVGDDGVFDYYWRRTGAFVRYTVAGTNTFDGCSWDGRGAFYPTSTHDSIRVSFGRPRGFLSAQLRVRPEYHFTVRITCPNGVSRTEDFYPSRWGGGYEWFATGTTAPRFPDPGLTRVLGEYTVEGSFPATHHWDLVAQV